MSKATIKEATFRFLSALARHNNRDWFNSHKAQYLEAHDNAVQFVDALIVRMSSHDHIETISAKKSLYRIYNDVRFFKDKAPYDPRFAGYLRRAKPMLRGGYYYWIKPGGSRIGCGFAYPNPADLKRIRADIEVNGVEWKRLLRLKSIQSNFGAMKGDQVRTAPRGFSQDHPAIELLRYKQFWFVHEFSDAEVLSEDFLDNMNRTFKSIRPFFNYMSEVLTTDMNGERST